VRRSFRDRAAEQIHEVIADGLLARGGAARQIALDFGAMGLPRGHCEAHRHGREDHCDGGDAPPVARERTSQQVVPRTAARDHRLVPLGMLDVFHQRVDIGVASDGVLAQAGRDDRVQVAGQPPCRNRRIRSCRSRAQRRRFVMHDLLHDAADRKALAAPGTSSAQQLEQQDPERIDVGGDGDGLSGQLFRGRIVGRERGHRCVGDALPARIEPLGDAEVEQLHSSFGGDQDVSRLQVAVDDQVAMRVVDRLAHLQEERQPIVQAGMPALAMLDDGFAAHVLDHSPQPAVRRGAAIQQARDAGMVQGRERLPLGMKARDVRRGVAVQQLQGDGQVEHAIGTRSRIDFSGAASPDQGADQPGADPGARRELRRWCRSTRRMPARRAVQQARVGVVRGAQRAQFLQQPGIVTARSAAERVAPIRGDFDGFGKEPFQHLPAGSMHDVPRSRLTKRRRILARPGQSHTLPASYLPSRMLRHFGSTRSCRSEQEL
jgi:hypothetical protein